MNKENDGATDSRTTWLHALAILTALYLMYSPVFLTDYLMKDEWTLVGSRPDFWESAKEAFFQQGRAIFGICYPLVYRFAGYDPYRIQLVRFINFASLAAIACLLFLFLKKISKNASFSSLVVLFLFSQPSFQSVMAYSLHLISNTLPAMWLSLLAFHFQFCFRGGLLSKPFRLLVVSFLLLVAMLSTQTYAFFAMVPLSYLALADWTNQRRKVFEFLALAFLAFVLSAFIYEQGLNSLHKLGTQGYRLGEQAVAAAGKHPLRVILHAANPFAYWSAFEIWSYPFPVPYIHALGRVKTGMARAVVFAWVLLLLMTAISEVRGCLPQERRDVFQKWLAALACLGFGAVFIVADSPVATIEHRPHMVITFVGVVVLIATYCLQVLISKHPPLGSTVPKALGVIFVVVVALGAQAAILRAFVNNRKGQLDFVRTELMAGYPHTYQDIIVILPAWVGCVTEPCGPWEGQITEDLGHLTHTAGYLYALATVGISPAGKVITFVSQKPKDLAKDSIVIDWQKYTRTILREGTHAIAF